MRISPNQTGSCCTLTEWTRLFLVINTFVVATLGTLHAQPPGVPRAFTLMNPSVMADTSLFSPLHFPGQHAVRIDTLTRWERGVKVAAVSAAVGFVSAGAVHFACKLSGFGIIYKPCVPMSTTLTIAGVGAVLGFGIGVSLGPQEVLVQTGPPIYPVYAARLRCHCAFRMGWQLAF